MTIHIIIIKQFYMLNSFNSVKVYATKLLQELNPEIGEQEIYTSYNIYTLERAFSILEKRGIAIKEVLGTEEVPLILNDIPLNDELEDSYELDTDLSAYQGVILYHVDGYTYLQVRVGSPTQDYQESDITLTAITKEMFEKIVKLAFKDEQAISNLPKSGIHRVKLISNPLGTSTHLTFNSIDDIQDIPAIHPIKKELITDIDFFFSNIPLFSKFGQKPLRKSLLFGEPGTGKTSICYDIAKKYSKEMPVVFVTNFDSLQKYLQTCADENQRTIIIYEDCESTLRSSRNNSEVLNFLDGIDRPNIVNGGVIIMTTNHPKEIDARISKRPGRVDKIYSVDALQGTSAYDVFSLYFSDFMKENNFDYTTTSAKEAIEIIAAGMTGAQIKELFNSYVCFMVSNSKEFNLYDIFEIRNNIFESFKKVDEEESSLTTTFEELSAKLTKILR